MLLDASDIEIKRRFEAIANGALKAADAGLAMRAFVPDPPKGRTLCLGAGKAAAAMAATVERRWDRPLEGFVTVPPGHGLDLKHLRVIEAGHPVPDLQGQAAAAEALLRAAMLGPDDLLLVLLSGGASALWPAPVAGVTLAEKQALTRALLASGAPIGEINIVRKHLSRIKGGGLARAAGPAPVRVFAVSDIPSDDVALVGSGPCSPDPTTRGEAAAILARHGIEPAPGIAAALADPARETPKPGDPCFARVTVETILRPRDAIRAVLGQVQKLGYEPHLLGFDVEGEARDVARMHANIVRGRAAIGRRTAFVSGGELTVTRRGEGQGGPNREYALALALALHGLKGVSALAFDSDGIDGHPSGAGAMITSETLRHAQHAGLRAQAMLDANDSATFFETIGATLRTGPTRTNVNDIRVILIDP